MEADRLHTMFLAMADVRAMLIKLADRLHNMMTLDVLCLSKKPSNLYPEQHDDPSSQLLKSFDEVMVTSAADKLEQSLQEGSISYHVLYGPHQSLYSIHCKMLKKKLAMDEIHDIHGLRLIVENEEDCYKALQLRNISVPLHTVVMGEGSVPLEIQIRTKSIWLNGLVGSSRGSVRIWANTKHVLTTTSPSRLPAHSLFNAEDSPHSYKHCSGSDGPVFVIMIENDKDVLNIPVMNSSRYSPYRFSLKQALTKAPSMSLPLTEYREEYSRKYDSGHSVPNSSMEADLLSLSIKLEQNADRW
ncbi:probable GTP diphosphokinase RSH2, chloroplastic [Tanacetum coccineum]